MPIQPCHRTMPIKPSSTPPSVKRQLSVPGNGSPIRRPGTPTTSNSNRSTPTRKVPILKGVDPKLAQVILDEILEGGASVQWEDIAGQEVCHELSSNYRHHYCCLMQIILQENIVSIDS